MSFIKRWFFGDDEGEQLKEITATDVDIETKEAEISSKRRKIYREEHEKGNVNYDDQETYIGLVQELGWSLTDIKGIGKKTAEKFANAGIHNPTQLLFAEDLEDEFPTVSNYISRFVEQLKKQLDNEGGDN